MTRFKRRLGTVLGVCVILLLGSGLALYAWLARSLPVWSGDAVAHGLAQPLEIVRDAHGVPHIFGQTEADAYFGLGYVHAQDRLWQLELNRRVGSGTLSEIFGEASLPRDRLLRTLGLRSVAQQNLERLDAGVRSALDAYARGVNAFLESDPSLPPEFGLLGVRPAPWSPVDSLIWLKVMAWNLSANLDSELWRWALSERLSPAQVSEFLTPYPGDPAIVFEALPELYGVSRRPTGARRPAPRLPTPGLGSNNWVVDGSRTQSGKPLLANDPHLGLTSPGIWYLAHLHAPGLSVVGASLPSLPGIVLGRNEAVAWTFTNTGSDAQDLYLERLLPGDESRYQTPSGSEPFMVRRERIAIKGQADELLLVRSTRHGPVISGVYEGAAELVPEGHVLALAWTALAPDDQTFRFVVEAAHARDAAELEAAARAFQSPQQNIVYADVAGRIGFVAAGRVPLRRADNELMGLLPAPGWVERYDWQGFVPFEELPREQQPASGRIVTANQKITPPGYTHWLTSEWSEPFRAERITALLDATARHDIETFSKIQLDVHSSSAATQLPRMLAALKTRSAELSPRELELVARLEAWQHVMAAEASEPLLYAAWVRELARAVYADELGELFEDAWAERSEFLGNVLSDQAGQGRWCDEIGSAATESCADDVLSAFRAALAYLEDEYGPDPATWSWGRAHRSRARHFPMTRVPVLRDGFDVVTASAGGNDTVNVGAYSMGDEDAPFEARHAAGFRAIYDLGELRRSVFLTPAGQSGHVLSRYYRNWVERWKRGELVPMLTDRAEIEPGALGTLRLTPR